MWYAHQLFHLPNKKSQSMLLQLAILGYARLPRNVVRETLVIEECEWVVGYLRPATVDLTCQTHAQRKEPFHIAEGQRAVKYMAPTQARRFVPMRMTCSRSPLLTSFSRKRRPCTGTGSTHSSSPTWMAPVTLRRRRP